MTSEAAGTLFELLGSKARSNPLGELTLSTGDITRPMTADQMVIKAPHHCLSYETFKPLLVFGSLRHLEIWWGEQISLDDDEVTKLAHSWPLLEVFDLYCGRGGHPPFSTKYPTLRGLLSLVASCPNLHAVSLPLDATHVTEIDAGPRTTKFTCLMVPESPIGLATPVAEFMFKHLPRVTMLDHRFLRPPGTDVPQIETYERVWNEAEAHLRHLHGFVSLF